MIYHFIEQQAAIHPVCVLCRVLGVSSSGYYGWRRRPLSQRAMSNQKLLSQIQMVHQQSRQTYGSPKIQQALRQQGICCGRNRIMRLMRQAGLCAKRQRCFRRTTQANARHAYLTAIATGEGWLYLAAVLDLYARHIVGWAMDRHMGDGLTQAALHMALRQRRPQCGQLLHHSDRGSQYTSGDYQRLLAQQDMQVSMSAKGNCYDNAPMESFFAQLKTELVYHARYPTRQAAMSSIFAYIEGFYNRQRLHSALGYLSPAQFEAAYTPPTFA